MNCIDIEDFIRFASAHPENDDAALAAHLMVCPECQVKFRMAWKAVHSNFTPTANDFNEAHNIVKKRLAQQDKLGEILRFLLDKLKSAPVIFLSSLAIPHLTANVAPVFGAAPRRLSGVKVLPEIPFASQEPADSPYFWKATLKLPMMLQKVSSIPMQVFSAQSQPIHEATLLFRGVPIAVKNGVAQLSIADFQKSMQGQGISLEFPDRHISQGEILLR